MLGVGIFLAPALIASYAGSVSAYMLYWIIGGLTALAGAASFAELGTMMPRSGGEYAFLQRAFGNSVGLAAGWTLVLVVFPGSIASMVAALTEYQVIPWLNALFDVSWSHTDGIASCLSVVIILLLTLLNIAGARLSSSAQTVIVTLPLALLAALALGGLAFGPEASAPVGSLSVDKDLSRLGVFSMAFMATYFAYSGWNAIGYVAGEVENPSRNVPLALLGGTAIVTTIYLLLAWFFVQTLGLEGLRRAPEAGSSSVGAWLGPTLGAWMSVPIAFGVLASTNSSVLGGARISFALAQDGLLPRAFQRIAPSTSTPYFALWVQAAVSIVLILTGTFKQLLMLTSLTMIIIGAAAVAAVIRLRRLEPHTPRPFRVPMYPLAPMIYLGGSLLVIGSQCHSAVHSLVYGTSDTNGSHVYVLSGLVAFVSIIALHALWQRFKTASSPPDSSS